MFSAFIGTVEMIHQSDAAGILPHVVLASFDSNVINDAELVSFFYNLEECVV